MRRFAARRLPLVALLALPAWSATAQHPLLAAPGTVGRPLHERVARADRAAIASVASLEPGRVHFRDAVPVFGEVPSAFAVKRAPANPPAISAGDRVLLLLRGARSPYVFADPPGEIAALGAGASEERWRDAVAALRDARDRPSQMRDLYLELLSDVDGELRLAAAVSLSDPQAPFQPLPEAALARLASVAVEDDSPKTRFAAAVASLRDASGRERLLASLPGASADPQVVTLALRAARIAGDPGAIALQRRCLGHASAALRRSALRSGLGDASLLAEVRRLAESDPDPDVRSAAESWLALERRAEAAGSSRTSDGASR